MLRGISGRFPALITARHGQNKAAFALASELPTGQKSSGCGFKDVAHRPLTLAARGCRNPGISALLLPLPICCALVQLPCAAASQQSFIEYSLLPHSPGTRAGLY